MSQSAVVICAARFGANYFLDLYAQSRPDDIVLYEVFRKGSDSLSQLSQLLDRSSDDIKAQVMDDPAGLWLQITQAADDQNRNVIAKAYYYHQPRNSALWDAIRSQSRVIHLVRQNLFEGFLSREIAMKTGRWSARPSATEKTANLSLNPAEVNKYIRDRQRDIEWCRSTFAQADYHELTFEEITLSPRRCTKAIGRVFPEFNGLPSNLRSKLGKLKRISNADIVTNYPEVAHLDLPLA